MEETNCNHGEVIAGVCINCGSQFMQLSGDIQGVSVRSTTSNSIYSYFKDLAVDDEIKQKADEIYKKLNSHEKKKHKCIEIAFPCLYNAHKELNVVVDPFTLASMMKISKKIVPKLLNNFVSNSGYKPVIKVISPISFIKTYTEILNIDYVEDIEKFCIEICEKNKELCEQYPQKISASIIQYYMELHEVPMNKKQFAIHVKLNEATITNTIKELRIIYKNET